MGEELWSFLIASVRTCYSYVSIVPVTYLGNIWMIGLVYWLNLEMKTMKRREAGHASLQQVALLIACFAAICKADDLMINEESVALEQSLSDQAAASKNLDLVFLIHTSTNINKQKFNYYKQFLRDTIQNANIDAGNVRVGMVVYKKRPNLEFRLKKYTTKEEVLNAIKNLKLMRAKTGDLAAGLDLIRTRVLTEKAGARSKDTARVVIVLTDAVYKRGLSELQISAQALKDEGTKIFAVGVRLQNATQLETVASTPADSFNQYTFVKLGKAKDEIVKQVPALQQDEAGDDTGLTVDNSNKVDLAILYHMANKMRPVDIDKFLQPFLISLLEKTGIDSGNVRVALINYAKKARVHFKLDKYRTFAQIRQEIEKIDRNDRAAKSSAGAGLNEIRTKIFTRKDGDRDDAPNAIIIITDEPNSDDQQQFRQEAEVLKAAGVKIITVGIQAADVAELRTVASDPVTKNAIYTKSYASLVTKDVVDSIRSTVRGLQDSSAGVPFTPRATPRPIITDAPRPGADLKRDDRADIVFAVHFNKAKSQTELRHINTFIQSLLAEADIDGGRVRVSQYFDGRGMFFNFNTHITNSKIRTVIGNVKKSNFDAQKFDLSGSLRAIRTNVFTPENGDREGVANTIILITDTNSGQDDREITREKMDLDRAGIQVFSVGIGLKDKGELERVASSDRNVFTASNYNELKQSVPSIKKDFLALNTRTEPVTRKFYVHQVQR